MDDGEVLKMNMKHLCYETPIRTSFSSLVPCEEINTGSVLETMY